MKTFISIFLFAPMLLIGQYDTIHFVNPSFKPIINEDTRHLPDYQNANLANCSVNDLPPKIVNGYGPEGDTYLALYITQDRDWTSASQRITKPLRKGGCYTFTVALATAKQLSVSKVFNPYYQENPQPVILRIYAGKKKCHMGQLIGETQLISHNNWYDYHFSFEALDFYNTITFEVYYQVATINHYDGNILLDNLSPIVMIPCMDSYKIDQSFKDKYASTKHYREMEIVEKRDERDFRVKGAKLILNEKIEALSTNGIFLESEKEFKPEAKELINQIIILLKDNPSIGIDIGIKKNKNNSLRKWRINYLNEIFWSSNIARGRADVDKIGQFLDPTWEYENESFGIRTFIKNSFR